MTSTELARLVKYEDFGLQWSDFGLDDVPTIFPFVSLVQGTSRMKGADKHGGEFYHTDRDEFTPELSLVILARSNTRALFDEGGEKPLCKSFDGIVPVPNQPVWDMEQIVTRTGPVAVAHGEPPKCGVCVFQQWGQGEPPPPCREADVYLIDRGFGDVARLRVNGTNLRPIRNWLATAVMPKKVAPFNFRLTIKTIRKQEPGRIWHEMIVDGYERVGIDEAQTYAELVRQNRARFHESLDEDEPEGPKDTTWGDGKEPFTGSRTPPVDADGVIQERRTPTPSPLSRTAAEMFPKVEQP